MNATLEKTKKAYTYNFDEIQHELKNVLSNIRVPGKRVITCRVEELSKPYRNSEFINGKISDVKSNKTMEFSIKEKLAKNLYVGHIYEFEGTVRVFLRTANNCINGGLSFNVEKIENAYEKSRNTALSDDYETNQILNLLSEQKKKKNIESLLWKHLSYYEPIKVHVICGVNNEVFSDLKNACNIDKFVFTTKNVPIDDIQEIKRAIRLSNYEECDFVAIIRGGGDIAAFNSLIVAKTIIECQKPIITALGHSQDITMADRAADFYCFTPTALGEYFKSIFLNHNKNISSKHLSEKMDQLQGSMPGAINKLDNALEELKSIAETNNIKKAKFKIELYKALFWIATGAAGAFYVMNKNFW